MKKLFAILFVLVLVDIGKPVKAIPLQDLFDGQDLIVDDKVFFDWTLINLVVTDPVLDPDLGLIDVIPLEDQPLNPGIRFEANGQLVVTDLNFLDLQFGFSVATLDPRLFIKDNSLEIVDFGFGGIGGVIAIIETVSDAGGNILADKFVQADQLLGVFDLFDTATFARQSEIFVEKNILLAGDFSDDAVSLDVFEQRFSQVAEPTSGALIGLGLAGLCFARRRLTL